MSHNKHNISIHQQSDRQWSDKNTYVGIIYTNPKETDIKKSK